MKPLITIFAATCQDIPEHEEALRRTAEVLPIAHVVKLYQPPAPWSKLEQTRFLTHNLLWEIETEFVLTVHLDGYGLHRDCWRNEFLEYDYIGAPWPLSMCVHYPPRRVGNSGFSLRSRKWMAATQGLLLPNRIEEDAFVCWDHYDAMVHDAECKIAPVQLALQFSFENPLSDFPHWKPEDSFGFHGYFRPESLRKDVRP